MKAEVSKKIGFEAAHFLPNYEGKCSKIHGHHWEVEICCSGKVGTSTGMVVDFIKMKELLGWVDYRYDHKFINDFIKNPTAENIALDILREFELWCIAQGLRWEYIKVWESEDSFATLRNTEK